MKEFDDLQQLWQKGLPRKPLDFGAVMRRIEKGRQAMAAVLWWHVLAFGIGLALLLYCWFTVAFVTWTSHLGLLLLALCLGYALLAQWKSYRDLRSLSAESLDRPAEYMAYLKQFKAERYRQHTRSFRIYETCLILAFALFSFELYFVLPMGLFAGLIAFVVFWFLISHFVFLKAYIANEQDRIQALINDLDRISGQVGSED